MISSLFSRLVILFFGTLYPAYSSYKAIRTKNVKEYVKWMMYWIVFALFTCIETFTDIFLSWFPFYYEVKVVIVLWLLSPATKGSSTLYRKFVHPMLISREQEIDDYLNQAKERGYSAVLQLGSKSVNYATNVIMQTALKGGGNLVQSIKRSYSLSDLSQPEIHRIQDEGDQIISMRSQPQLLRPRNQTGIGRAATISRHSTGMYFNEKNLVENPDTEFNYNIRLSDDISSGYSSAEPVGGSLSRTSSLSNSMKTRSKSRRNEIGNHKGFNSKDKIFLKNKNCDQDNQLEISRKTGIVTSKKQPLQENHSNNEFFDPIYDNDVYCNNTFKFIKFNQKGIGVKLRTFKIHPLQLRVPYLKKKDEPHYQNKNKSLQSNSVYSSIPIFDKMGAVSSHSSKPTKTNTKLDTDNIDSTSVTTENPLKKAGLLKLDLENVVNSVEESKSKWCNNTYLGLETEI